MTDWFSSSRMATRGVAKGRAGATHHLTEERQGEYRYVYGPYSPPVLTIRPGDVVIAETLDAFGGAIKTVDDLPSQKLNLPFVNPQNGPIRIEGAVPGDVVCVKIESIMPRGPQPAGTSALPAGTLPSNRRFHIIMFMNSRRLKFVLGLVMR